MNSKICEATIGFEYPHHWDCRYIKTGHPGCTCQGDGKSCDSSYCTITDTAGSRSRLRVPDGSAGVQTEIKQGKTFCGIREISGNLIGVAQIGGSKAD